jgi:four helix bundle protein
MNKDVTQEVSHNENLENDKEKKKQDLRKRLKEYALRIIWLYEFLPKFGAVHVISHQLLRSGTSPGAQYSEACRAKSNADFISKTEGALQELEESSYWLELLIYGEFVAELKLKTLCDETKELIAIFVTIVVNTKAKMNSKK